MAVVLDGGSTELALAAAGVGATVVVVGSDASALGVLAHAVDETGGRALVFFGEAGSPALREMLAEIVSPKA